MKIQSETIQRAFDAFHNRYVAKARRAWDLEHHARLWKDAQQALAAREVAGFQRVYAELRSHWQLARGKGATLAAPEVVFPLLCNLPAPLRQARLSQQTDADAPGLLRAVETLACVKQTGTGPSIMAISKVLHFFNPRLFVIVDRGMVWDWGLNHLWLWRQIEPTCESLRATLKTTCEPTRDGACDPISYVAILLWAGRVVRDNPEIPASFAGYLRSKCAEGQLPSDVESFEAVAIEWLLLGLVELPPLGVAIA